MSRFARKGTVSKGSGPSELNMTKTACAKAKQFTVVIDLARIVPTRERRQIGLIISRRSVHRHELAVWWCLAELSCSDSNS